MQKDSERRAFQTKTHRLIKAKSSSYATCTKKHKLFTRMQKNRINITLIVAINPSGEITKFKLDDKKYPESFVNCVFDTTQLINFPKNPEKLDIEITQPFTFSYTPLNP